MKTPRVSLITLLAQRNAALAQPRLPLAWNRLAPEERATERAIVARCEAAGAAIVAELKRRKGPVRVGKVVLYLTADRASFVEINPTTNEPVHMARRSRAAGGWRNLLYRYPTGQRNCPVRTNDVP